MTTHGYSLLRLIFFFLQTGLESWSSLLSTSVVAGIMGMGHHPWSVQMGFHSVVSAQTIQWPLSLANSQPASGGRGLLIASPVWWDCRCSDHTSGWWVSAAHPHAGSILPVALSPQEGLPLPSRSQPFAMWSFPLTSQLSARSAVLDKRPSRQFWDPVPGPVLVITHFWLSPISRHCAHRMPCPLGK
jgi:hypothetical protein